MATADEIRAQIAAEEQQLEQAKAQVRRASELASEAEERQKLRTELEAIRIQKIDQEDKKRRIQIYTQKLDHDEIRWWQGCDSMVSNGASTKKASSDDTDRRHVEGEIDYGAAVVSGELEWSIKGFSWLAHALYQKDQQHVESDPITIGGHDFSLLYHPRKGDMGTKSERGSLVIYHEDCPRYEGVAFRYSIWIKSQERGFIQWGDSGDVCEGEGTDGMIYGPDVCDGTGIPVGIFQMSHTQLMHSEWVIDDVLTAKLKVEVRQNDEYDERTTSAEIIVPSSSLSDRLTLLLDSGAGCDVSFIAQGEKIRAHSPIVAACSDVFHRLLACGMHESISKEVTIEDCDPQIFKVFLRYVYSDSFASLESFIASKVSEQTSSDAPDNRILDGEVSARISILQQILAVSHKYQVTRLQLWCERELCRCITVGDVCTVLCQAHLYEAKQLEKKCLEFIKAHKNEVVRTDAFGSLSPAWPQVNLKITLHMSAIDESSAAEAIDKQQSGHKRKRDSSGD